MKSLSIAVCLLVALCCATFFIGSASAAAGHSSFDVKRSASKREYIEGLYDLIPGRYPHAQSLPDMLKNMDKNQGGREVIQLLAEYLVAKLHLNSTWVPIIVMDFMLDRSETFFNLLALTPLEMHDLAIGIDVVEPPTNYTHPNDHAIKTGFEFPNDIFNDNMVNVTMSEWIPTIGEVVNGSRIWWGFFFPNTTTVEQARRNVVMSLVFNQLVANSHIVDTNDHFYIVYKTQRYYDVRSFLYALHNEQVSIGTFLTKRIAAFFGLYTTDAAGNFYEVADPAFVATGLYNSSNVEVVLPAIHSEFVIQVNSTVENATFEIVWYQGDDGIGFFPSQMYVLESWVGDGYTPTTYGAAAIEAITYMGLYSDILLQVVYKEHYFDWGYAVTGVCDDSCGLLEIIMNGASTEYPNLMTKSVIVPEVMLRLKYHDQWSSYYYKLLTTINAFPMDWRYNPNDNTLIERAQGTIVWEVGQEPFECVVVGRSILNGTDIHFNYH